MKALLLSYFFLSTISLFASSSIELTQISNSKAELSVELANTATLESYEIQSSSDLNNWTTLKNENDLSQNPSSHELNIPSEAQYIRLKLNESSANEHTFIEPEFVTITGGNSYMGKFGGDNRSPKHGISISSFQMGKYEVSNNSVLSVYNWALEKEYIYIDSSGSFKQVYENNENNRPLLGLRSYGQIRIHEEDGILVIVNQAENEPCISISWLGAVYFCNWASEMQGYTPCYDIETYECDFTANGYRLPTEAEWEYTAYTGITESYTEDTTLFPFGDEISHELANYKAGNYSYETGSTTGFHSAYTSNGIPYLAPMDSFSGNSYGIHNLAGNVAEWCYDTYYDYPESITDTDRDIDPAYNEGELETRITRGGSFLTDASYCDLTVRVPRDYELLSTSNGFRICRKAE